MLVGFSTIIGNVLFTTRCDYQLPFKLMLFCQAIMVMFCFCEPKSINLICDQATHKLTISVMLVGLLSTTICNVLFTTHNNYQLHVNECYLAEQQWQYFAFVNLKLSI
jgi:hypothetical protein